MKARLLFLQQTVRCWPVCLLLGAAIAHAEEDGAVDGNVSKPEATIWLEEKISPSSRWMEELVQPMTTWVEEQLHGESSSGAAAPDTGSDVDADPPSDANFISVDQAIEVASTAFPGEVLHSKLLPQSARYRIKLLTMQGVIHIVYVDAVSADILPQQTQE